MANTMLKISKLKKSFGDHEVLKGISFDMEESQVISVIGPSGSGKSTFLRCMNLLERPTSGHVIFDGLDSNTIYTAVLDEFSLVSSNFKDVYTRNRFRKYIVPQLKKEDINVHKKFYKFSK